MSSKKKTIGGKMINKTVQKLGSFFSSSSKISRKAEVRFSSDDMGYSSLKLNQTLEQQQKKGWQIYTSKIRQSFRYICEAMLKEGKNEIQIKESFEGFREVFISDIWRSFFFESGLAKILANEVLYDYLVNKIEDEQKLWDSNLEELMNGGDVNKIMNKGEGGFFHAVEVAGSILGYIIPIPAISIIRESKEAKKKIFETIKKTLEDIDSRSQKVRDNTKNLIRKSLSFNSGTLMTMLKFKYMKEMIVRENIIVEIVKHFGKDGFFKLITDELNFALAEEGTINFVVSGVYENKGVEMFGKEIDVTCIKKKKEEFTEESTPTKRVSFHQRQITHTRE